MNIVRYPNYLGTGETQQKWVANPNITSQEVHDFLEWHNKLYDIMDSINLFDLEDLNSIRYIQVKFNHVDIYDPNTIPPLPVGQDIIDEPLECRGKWYCAALKIVEFIERVTFRGDNKLGQHIAEWRLNKDGIKLN